MSILPPELFQNLTVVATTPVAGGSIGEAYRVETSSGVFFAKTHRTPPPGMFGYEAMGLAMLAQASSGLIGVPDVLAQSENGIVLSWIPPGRPNRDTDADFGTGLAEIHRHSPGRNGHLGQTPTGYIGTIAIDFSPASSWPEFFLERLVIPLTRRAVDSGHLDVSAVRLSDRLNERRDLLCGPPEPVSLLHGDLWSGNRFVGAGGRNWLIDPACYGGHREVDLAMMALFGGFSSRCWDAYREAYELSDGWEGRVRWYQLPPLLVHTLLFGRSYSSSVMDTMRHYL